MANSNKIPNATFSRYMATVIPFFDDLQAYFLFGGNAAQSAVNLVNNVSATVVGAPVVDANSSTQTGQNGYRTAIQTNGGVTYVAVTQIPASSFLMGHHTYDTPLAGEGTRNGQGIFMNGGSFFLQFNGGSAVSLVPGNTAGYHFVAGGFDYTRKDIYYYTGGVAQTATTGPTATIGDSKFFRVGAHSTVANTLGTATKAAAAMMYGRLLSAAEIDQVRVYLTAKLATRGITVA